MHHVLNVAVLGESQVGKTTILSKYCSDNDNVRHVKYGAKKQIPYRIKFWDGNYPDDGQMDGMILVYDCTNFKSFQEVSTFLKQHRADDQSYTFSLTSLKMKSLSGIFKVEPQKKSSIESSFFDLSNHETTQCIVLANKHDLNSERQVYSHHYENLKERHKDIDFYRVSAETEDDLVESIIDDFIRSKVISTSIIHRVANGTYSHVENNDTDESECSSLDSEATAIQKIEKRVIRVTYI